MSDGQSSVPRAVIEEVLDSFLIPPTIDFEGAIHFVSEGFRYAKILDVAIDGLKGILSTASLPFQLVEASVVQRKFDRVFTAERILILKEVGPWGDVTEIHERKAYETADHKMSEFASSSEGTNFFRDEIILELSRTLKVGGVAAATQELLAQSLISAWSVFENFSRSAIIEYLNARPSAAAAVISLPAMKDFFGRKAIDIDVISRYDYNLSSFMGDVLFGDRRLDSLTIIKPLLRELLGDAEIQIALSDEIWELNQLRHLFVHRRGLVDREFLGKTNSKIAIGERVNLKSDNIEKSIKAVLKAIVTIGSALSRDEGVS